MDPITQGAFGSVFAQLSITRRKNVMLLGKAALIGALSGMAADLDVLIRSSEDPLLALEFHRHFTHSLLFIPFGALLCALVFYIVFARRWRMRFSQVYLLSFLGYATHGLLDGCTSYGTQLLWPLSDERFAWDIVSIIDPVLTLPLLGLIALSVVYKKRLFVKFGVLWLAGFLSLGAWQHQRAASFAWQQVDAMVNHQAVYSLSVKPSFANLLVWKVIVETGHYYHVFAVRPGVLGWIQARTWPGDKLPKLNIARDLPWLDSTSQQAKDIERFSWFSQGFVAIDPEDSNHVIDMRYSLLPYQIKPLWGIVLNPEAGANEYVRYQMAHGHRSGEAFSQLWRMLFD